MRKIAGYLTKNRSEKDQKIAQSTHENEYIKPRKTFWRNSKQLLRIVHTHIACTDNLKEVEPRTSGSFLPRTLDNLEEVEPCLTAGGSPKGNTCGLSRLPSPPSTSKRLI
ncbi:hypothetical protein [Phocaeicola salanitronis]|uniref:hypothetical protein n=1 Tax=Phocaeicola salanitronis TaxID=376805 RepID=UPI0032093787